HGRAIHLGGSPLFALKHACVFSGSAEWSELGYSTATSNSKYPSLFTNEAPLRPFTEKYVRPSVVLRTSAPAGCSGARNSAPAPFPSPAGPLHSSPRRASPAMQTVPVDSTTLTAASTGVGMLAPHSIV